MATQSTGPAPAPVKPAEAIWFAPGDCFFVRDLTLPEDVKGSEIAEFAELALEDMSPFSIEQLNWGYVVDESAGHVLVYAAYRERLRARWEGIGEIEEYIHVFPDFVAGLTSTADEVRYALISAGSSLSVLRFPAGRLTPDLVRAQPLPLIAAEPRSVPPPTDPDEGIVLGGSADAEADDGEVAVDWSKVTDELAPELLQAVGASRNAATIAVVEAASVDSDGRVVVHVGDVPAGSDLPGGFSEASSPGGSAEANAEEGSDDKAEVADDKAEAKAHGHGRGAAIRLGREALWAADIRDGDFKVLERRRRRLTGIVRGSIVAAGIAAALLLVGQVALFGTGKWIEKRTTTVAAKEADVRLIEENLSLVERLESLVQQEMRPFHMLAQIALVKPRQLHFEKTNSERFDQIELEGEGGTVAMVNQYADIIRQQPNILDVEHDVSVSGGRTIFEFTVSFSEPPALETEAPIKPLDDETDDEEAPSPLDMLTAGGGGPRE